MGQSLIIISELYFPEETSTGYFLTGIAEGLAADSCFDVSVLCAQPTYSQKGVQAPKHEIRNGVRILRLSAPLGDKNKLLGRLWGVFSLTLRFSWSIVRNVQRGDRVLVVTNPPTLPIMVSLVSKLKGAQACLLVHDIYPDVLVAVGMTSARSFIYRTVDLIQRWMLKRMERVVVLGRDMRERIRSKLAPDSDEKRISIIPNWGEVEKMRPELHEGNPLREQLGLQEKFIIQFSGNLGRTHGLSDLVALAKVLRANERIHFLVFGWGAGQKYLEEQIRVERLNNVTLLPPCDKEELPVYLTACDLFYLPFRLGMEGISVPSRLYNVMAAGNPVLAVAGQTSELAQVVDEESIGWVVEPGKIDAMLEVVEEAVSSPNRLEEMRARARKAAEGKYTREVVIRSFAELLEKECAG